MARVVFTVKQELRASADEVFAELVNWKGHAEWVPMTRVEILEGDGGVGTTFVATTGLGPAALPDRMRVDALDADKRTVHITKIGPVLTGEVDLTVTATSNTTSELTWVEDVRVPGLPGFLSRPVAAATRKGFEKSIERMARRLRVA